MAAGNKKVIPEDKIWEVCESLGIGHLKSKKDMTVGMNGRRLSSSETVLITLARALLSSVDILLLSNTLDNLDPEPGGAREKVLQVLKEMIDNRGLSYDIPSGSSLSLR